MKLFAALFSLFILSSFQMQQQKKKIVFFGDSITQAGVENGGYIRQLDSMINARGLSAKYELAGAGIGGNKIYDLYLRLEDDVLKQKPNVVVIWVGVNDVWHKRSHGTGTDADKFEKFYSALIKKLQQQNIEVFLVTPAAIGEKTDFTNELDGDLNRYAEIIRKLASSHAVKLIDIRKSFLEYNLQHNKENKESGVLTSDRVHLNKKGNELVAKEMFRAVVEGV